MYTHSHTQSDCRVNHIGAAIVGGIVFAVVASSCSRASVSPPLPMDTPELPASTRAENVPTSTLASDLALTRTPAAMIESTTSPTQTPASGPIHEWSFADITGASWSSSGNLFALSGTTLDAAGKAGVYLFGVDQKDPIWQLEDFGAPDLAISSDGSSIVTLGPNTGELTVLNARDGSVNRSLDGTRSGCGQEYLVALAGEDQIAYAVHPGNTRSNTISYIDKWLLGSPGSCSGSVLDHPGFLNELQLSLDGSAMMAGFRKLPGEHDRMAVIYDIDERRAVCEIVGSDPAIAASGNRLAITDEAGNVEIWRIDSCDHTATIPLSGSAKAFGPQGDRLAIYTGSTVVVWDIPNQDLLASWDWYQALGVRLYFAPDGAYLLAVHGGTAENPAHASVWKLP